MQEVAGVTVGLEHAGPRPGDVRDSLADIRLAGATFGFRPEVKLEQGLADYWEWFTRDPLTLKQAGARP